MNYAWNEEFDDGQYEPSEDDPPELEVDCPCGMGIVTPSKPYCYVCELLKENNFDHSKVLEILKREYYNEN